MTENIDKNPLRYSGLAHQIEAVITRRVYGKRIDGYVLEMSIELAELATKFGAAPDMQKFVVEEKVPTWITYRAEITAPNREEAIERFKEGVTQAETLFGDVVDGKPTWLMVDGVTVEG